MPPHHHWCKQCGSRSFEVLSVKDTVKMKCNGCGKVSYKSGRYAFRLARASGLTRRAVDVRQAGVQSDKL